MYTHHLWKQRALSGKRFVYFQRRLIVACRLPRVTAVVRRFREEASLGTEQPFAKRSMSDENLPNPPVNNFTAHHAVTLPLDLETAYRVIGSAEHLERVIRLSALTTKCEIFPKEYLTGDGDVTKLHNPYNLIALPASDSADGQTPSNAGFIRTKLAFIECASASLF